MSYKEKLHKFKSLHTFAHFLGVIGAFSVTAKPPNPQYLGGFCVH